MKVKHDDPQEQLSSWSFGVNPDHLLLGFFPHFQILSSVSLQYVEERHLEEYLKMAKLVYFGVNSNDVTILLSKRQNPNHTIRCREQF